MADEEDERAPAAPLPRFFVPAIVAAGIGIAAGSLWLAKVAEIGIASILDMPKAVYALIFIVMVASIAETTRWVVGHGERPEADRAQLTRPLLVMAAFTLAFALACVLLLLGIIVAWRSGVHIAPPIKAIVLTTAGYLLIRLCLSAVVNIRFLIRKFRRDRPGIRSGS